MRNQVSPKIVSGGQTGVDRAALDVALELGLEAGGWVPRGRRAEYGAIPYRYPVEECESEAYAERTRLNVRDSDATLVLTRRAPEGGTAQTIRFAENMSRPFLVVDLDDAPAPAAGLAWLAEVAPDILNVAGPRESSCPGIHGQAAGYLRELWALNSGRS